MNMKQTKKLFCAAIMIAAMTVLAGAQQAGGNTRDLVRALGSKAKANGNTVTFTGEVKVAKSLTVPAGVTLDLTANGVYLRLQNGATLTVNGTVNARGAGDFGKGWVDGGLCTEDGSTTVINGSGTINLKSKGNLLSIWGGGKGQKLTLDGVTLVGVADNDRSLVNVSEGGEFILKNGRITGNTNNDGCGGVGVWKATFTMEGGEISGNTSSGGGSGGGVAIGEGSVFILKSGKITGNNNTSDGGGGVSVWKATFTMEGGEISGNTLSGGGSGGGVAIGEGSVFTLKSGRITGNTIVSNEWATGGGVQVWKATFTMEGGEISGNTAKGGIGSEGGGVKIGEKSVFTMKSGTISGNSITSGSDAANGGGVNVSMGGTFTMSGGTISGNTVTGGRYGGGGGVALGGGGVKTADATFIMQGGTISGNTTTGGPGGSSGGGVALLRGGVFIMEGGTIYGKAESLPAGTNASLANSVRGYYASLTNDGTDNTAKWGTGGTYTKGGVSQTGGSNIARTDDTLIAVPAR